ncbi:hypothetical protein [Pantoea sp. JK]|uniref:hypothetical protein n=1 Tax=Pantoea sp. JK TaxID=2871703 RepID=UPI0022374CC0|nr:hypothetical protein [Pantoea sp. JK]MCW6034469.1 hypothetical protein [Pantoea sp. JK]
MSFFNYKKEEKKPKSQPTELISSLVKGSKDRRNDLIIDVLAAQNEFCIYEIDNEDINTRIRVVIDGHTDEFEERLLKRFSDVKIKYIEAKGILAISSNYGMMKHRIAHTLSTCLNSAHVNGNQEFDRLIKAISTEHESIVSNRLVYLTPAFLACIVAFTLIFIHLFFLSTQSLSWTLTTLFFASVLGGSFSILINAKQLNFEEFKVKNHYFLIGTERVFLSLMAGAIAYIAIRSQLILPDFYKSGRWPTLTIIVLSGFSESFIPSLLGKATSKEN